jgi:hypothetical protein
MVELPPGFFVPVSEDAEGVFYQSVKGVRPLRRYQPVGGGLYVGKADGKIWVFVGNAKLNVEDEYLQRQPAAAAQRAANSIRRETRPEKIGRRSVQFHFSRVGWVGLEPTTNALKGRCSTIELPTRCGRTF